jgi:hypothetical protein
MHPPSHRRDRRFGTLDSVPRALVFAAAMAIGCSFAAVVPAADDKAKGDRLFAVQGDNRAAVQGRRRCPGDYCGPHTLRPRPTYPRRPIPRPRPGKRSPWRRVKGAMAPAKL